MATEEKKEVVFDDGRIESIEEFQSPEALYQELITRVANITLRMIFL